MRRKHSWKQFAHLLVSFALVSGLLIPTTAFADDKGKGSSAGAGAQAQVKDDKKEAPKPAAASQTSTQSHASAPKNEPKRDEDKAKPSAQTQVETSNENAHKSVEYKPDDHPSGKDRSVEPGGSGTQGKSTSDPDGKSNGGTDNPELASQRSAPWNQDTDNDGNNGCGNDDDFEDDNNGWCGRDKAKTNPQAPTPVVGGEAKVHVKGCYVWNNDTDKPFFINEVMTEEQADQFEDSTTRISDDMDGCKKEKPETPEVKLVHIHGCYKIGNDFEFVNERLSEEDAEKFRATHTEVEKKLCEGTLGVEDKNPDVPEGDAHLKRYVCHRTGSMSNPFVLIRVSVNAEGHLRDDSHDRHDIHPEDIVFGETLPDNWEELCKLPENQIETKTDTKSFPLSGCFYNPVTKEYVFFQHQTFSTQAEVDAKVQGLVSQAMDQKDCKPPVQVLGIQDNNPPPPPGNPPTEDRKSEAVNLYGCFQKADGSYVHENRTFNTVAELGAYKASQGYVGIDASMPNPDQCKNPDRNDDAPPGEERREERREDRPAGVAGIQVDAPASVMSIAVTESEPESVNPLIVPAIQQDRPIDAIPLAEAPREGVQALVSEMPAPAAPQAVTPQQPVVRPTNRVLPTTGEPLIDMALLTLGFLSLTLVGLRFMRAGVRRA